LRPSVIGARRTAEHDQRTRADDPRPAALPAADAVADVLELGQVADPHTRERVGIAGQGERFHDPFKSSDGGVDLVDLGAGGESQFDEGLDVLAHPPMVEDGSVAANEPFPLKAVDAALGGRGRETHEAPDLAGRPPRVLDKQAEDAAIGRVEIHRLHEQIVTRVVK
jgi:hypothetical protein